MELWGSSYFLHDVSPIRLVALVGSSTSRGAAGSIQLSFMQEPGLFTSEQGDQVCAITMKWDVALRLMALFHILVIQNRLLRDEPPELRSAPGAARVFTVTGGNRSGPIECSWRSAAREVKCSPVVGGTDQFELIIEEGAAIELVAALAERIARNATQQ